MLLSFLIPVTLPTTLSAKGTLSQEIHSCLHTFHITIRSSKIDSLQIMFSKTGQNHLIAFSLRVYMCGFLFSILFFFFKVLLCDVKVKLLVSPKNLKMKLKDIRKCLTCTMYGFTRHGITKTVWWSLIGWIHNLQILNIIHNIFPKNDKFPIVFLSLCVKEGCYLPKIYQLGRRQSDSHASRKTGRHADSF